jgi:hypothetical protein
MRDVQRNQWGYGGGKQKQAHALSICATVGKHGLFPSEMRRDDTAAMKGLRP